MAPSFCLLASDDNKKGQRVWGNAGLSNGVLAGSDKFLDERAV
jgi:hypothetical protein